MIAQQPIAGYSGAPQKENGYTPIANELLEAIMLHGFSKRQLLIIMAICRMTFGYSKKSDALSGWQISKITGIDRSDISKSIDELSKINVLIKHESGRFSHGIFVNEVSINKYYDKWLTVGKLPTVGKSPPLVFQSITVGKSPTRPLVKHPTHKAIKTTKASIAKTSLPKDFFISERVTKWAEAKGHKNLKAHLDNFILTCESKNYTYVNWDSAFMKAIAANWAKVENKKFDRTGFL